MKKTVNGLTRPRATKHVQGPVDNLEKHLKPDWWRHIFNATYLKTDADVVEDQEITQHEIDIFEHLLALGQEAKILDVACGQGRHLIEWGRRGYTRLHGIDRSRYLIHRARARARQENLSIQFKEGDVRKLPYSTDSFDAVTILGNSFGYFESTEDDLQILRQIYRVLKPGGTLLMDVTDGQYIRSNFAERSWEWIDKKHFVCRERALTADGNRLISREVVTNTDRGVVVDQFYAERLYSGDDIKELMTQVGFQQVEVHGQIVGQSKRNQDLGMMEKRILATSRAIKAWTPVKVQKDVRQVAVLMGDPKLRDVIKPNGMFDADDHETINRLKAALGQLGNYRFAYLNNHSSFIQDLGKLKGKIDFVFNLCDEGFANDATFELHVPALLEILRIPYTGSTPQCLSYCYDKSLIRGIAAEMGISVAPALIVKPEDHLYDLSLSFPVIAKPNFGDSSFGITQHSVVSTIEDLTDAIARIRSQFGYDRPVLVEEFLTGAEISVGMVGNPGNMQILPLIEEDYSQLPEGLPKICGYEAKWLTDSPYFRQLRSIPAILPSAVSQMMVSDSMKMFERLNCRDYCRFDWRLDQDGKPCLLEVNPNPGWCWDGHLARMAELSGIDYPRMLELILQAAEWRLQSH